MGAQHPFVFPANLRRCRLSAGNHLSTLQSRYALAPSATTPHVVKTPLRGPAGVRVPFSGTRAKPLKTTEQPACSKKLYSALATHTASPKRGSRGNGKQASVGGARGLLTCLRRPGFPYAGVSNTAYLSHFDNQTNK